MAFVESFAVIPSHPSLHLSSLTSLFHILLLLSMMALLIGSEDVTCTVVKAKDTIKKKKKKKGDGDGTRLKQ